MKFKNLLRITFLLVLFAGVNFVAKAQDNPEEDHSYKPLKLNLSEDGKKYVRFIMWHQIWATTNNLSADDSKLQITPSIRRSRFLAFAQVSPRFLILTHFGLNSLTPGNLTSLGSNGNAPQLFLHDAWAEFKLHESVYFGGGLHYWKGMTRMANQSTLNFMTLDAPRPFVGWHSLGITDQFARHLGFYLKGAFDKFDYRIAANSPGRNNISGDFGTMNSGLSYTGASVTNSDGDPVGNALYEGYFRYNFWDTESTKLPYAVGTYLGKKKVFSIGAGFFAHPNGMYNANTNEHGNVMHFAVDAFLDMPVNDNGAVNAYAAFQSFNYGENYVARWAGTGTNLYAQLGYYVPSLKLMPYIAVQSGNYEGYDEATGAMDLGLNYFVNGHNAKATLEYHRVTNDPREGAPVDNPNSQLRLQFHVFL